MIVLNGNPFIKYSLRSLYPFAHQIIVVEGACPAAAGVATVDGHSRDGTLEALRQFKVEEDPLDKLVIVTAEDSGKKDGFWTEKSEMSQAYAARATGNFLWQIDSDEFYTPEALNQVRDLLTLRPDVTEVSFRTINFWGDLRCKVDGIILRLGDRDFHRLFAWGPGYKYVTHRPPTVVNESGRNVADIKSVSAAEMAKRDVWLYHYEYLFPHQVRNKSEYYAKAEHCQGQRGEASWAEECFMKLKRPYRVHNIVVWPSWLERFHGAHPPEIYRMMRDIGNDGSVAIRQTDDIAKLLRDWRYNAGVIGLKLLVPLVRLYFLLKMSLRALLIKSGAWPYVQSIRGGRGSLKKNLD